MGLARAFDSALPKRCVAVSTPAGLIEPGPKSVATLCRLPRFALMRDA